MFRNSLAIPESADRPSAHVELKPCFFPAPRAGVHVLKEGLWHV